MFVYKKDPVGIELFSHVKTLFYSKQFAKLLITWLKTIYTLDLVGPSSNINGAFHSTQIPVWDFGNSNCPMEQYIPVAQTQDPSRRTFGYCSCKQVTEKWYWGQQFCQMERDISVRPTRNDQRRSKRTTLKAGPEYSGRTQPKWSVPFDWHQLKFPELWLEWKASKHNRTFMRK